LARVYRPAVRAGAPASSQFEKSTGNNLYRLNDLPGKVSSPGSMPHNMAAISRAAVQECVSSAHFVPKVRSNHSWQRCVKTPFPEM
jgi:hypothetical protein